MDVNTKAQEVLQALRDGSVNTISMRHIGKEASLFERIGVDIIAGNRVLGLLCGTSLATYYAKDIDLPWAIEEKDLANGQGYTVLHKDRFLFDRDFMVAIQDLIETGEVALLLDVSLESVVYVSFFVIPIAGFGENTSDVIKKVQAGHKVKIE